MEILSDPEQKRGKSSKMAKHKLARHSVEHPKHHKLILAQFLPVGLDHPYK